MFPKQMAGRLRSKYVFLFVGLLLILSVLAGLLIWRPWSPKDPYKAKVLALVAPYRFSIPRWEVKALLGEADEHITVHPPPPSSEKAKTLVLQYLQVAQRIGALEGEVERLAAENPDESEVYAQMSTLQAEIAQLRARQKNRRPIVERILAKQVSTIIAKEHLGWMEQALPPVAFQFTEPPYYLILSYRTRIKMRMGVHLKPQLSLQTRENIENTLEEELPDTSALVEGIGGFSTWPTMVIDRASLEWILSTIAHEWTHTYLIIYPLGRHYYSSPDMSAINETVADIVGNEVGRETLVTFYPERVPPTPTPTPMSQPSQVRPLRPVTPTVTPAPTFDFVKEMRITRDHVDQLLAQGKVEEAERYMEERRRFFVAHGYYIRKLNQAYFAFHGTYRTGPAAPSTDPIGPRLRKLRQQSPTLADFLHTVRGISSMEDLMKLVPEP